MADHSCQQPPFLRSTAEWENSQGKIWNFCSFIVLVVVENKAVQCMMFCLSLPTFEFLIREQLHELFSQFTHPTKFPIPCMLISVTLIDADKPSPFPHGKILNLGGFKISVPKRSIRSP
jgi:hypothetical protein